VDVVVQDVFREEPALTGVAFNRLLAWLDNGSTVTAPCTRDAPANEAKDRAAEIDDTT
jgi:hypothetical protein